MGLIYIVCQWRA